MRIIHKLLLVLGCLLMVSTSMAQVNRHPKVAEMEKTLAKEGLELLKGRFPDKPFLIKVKVEPMFRDESRREVAAERLPYLDLTGEEVVDEWDDPRTPMSALIARVRKIHVNTSIPSSLTDDEVAELKETLISNLGMIEGRDSVEINKRNWGSLEETESALSREAVVWTLAGWLLFVGGLMAAAWYMTSRLGRSLKEGQKSTETSTPMAPLSTSGSGAQNSGPDNKGNSDIRFSDPIKNREMVLGGIRILATHPSFPNIEDMRILNRLGLKSPGSLGALLSEFPIELRTKVFGLSFGDFWLHGLSEPGEIASDSVELINKCLRIQRDDKDLSFQELMVLVWRLDDKIAEFFQGIEQNEAFSLLTGIPKSISLKIARENFPGSWGLLLDPDYKTSEISEKRILTLKERALKLKPLRSMDLLKKFQKESDLLEYLKTADPTTEKEIYKVAGEDSLVARVRPPFFKLFDLSEDKIQELVTKFRVEEWALALFNAPRDDRRLVEKFFSDKQKFRYLELLKSFDTSPPPKEDMGVLRERIAKLVKVMDQVKAPNSDQEAS